MLNFVSSMSAGGYHLGSTINFLFPSFDAYAENIEDSCPWNKIPVTGTDILCYYNLIHKCQQIWLTMAK